MSTLSYPVLPLRDIVVFPHMIVPLFVGREKSVRALEEVMQDDKQILLSSQKDPTADDPDAEGIFRTGVLANVLHRPSLLRVPAFALRLALGDEMANLTVLASQRVTPSRLNDAGFTWHLPTVEAMLRFELGLVSS